MESKPARSAGTVSSSIECCYDVSRPMTLTRRRFVHCSLCASGAWLVGSCGDDAAPLDAGHAGDDAGRDAGPRADAGGDAALRDTGVEDAAGSKCDATFEGGTMLGIAPFAGESTPLEVRRGEGWDGRLYTDLARVDRDRLLVENERFYIRTFYPDLLVPPDPWRIAIGGLVETPVSLSLDELVPLARPQGAHVLECSGNGRAGGFGLMSAAEWSGIPMSDVLAARRSGRRRRACSCPGSTSTRFRRSACTRCRARAGSSRSKSSLRRSSRPR
jgi:hypothetical protein